MPNVWKWKAVDKDGKPVDAAPGSPTFVSRGPVKLPDMVKAARILLDGKRRAAIRAGLADPGYTLVEESVEPVADSEAKFGEWRPPGTVPLQLPTESAPGAVIGRNDVDE